MSSSTSSGPPPHLVGVTTTSSLTSIPNPATHLLESSASTSSLSSLSLSQRQSGGQGGGGGERPIIPMPTPTTLSEWQLLAVLSKANLVQYYEGFIAQGGDDVNQIMACKEKEFMEIMQLVGMLPKPLHVRRFQQALTDFSQDRTAFNLAAFQQIGPPPPLNYTPPGTDPMALLLPGIAQATSPPFPSMRFLSQLAEKSAGVSAAPSEVGEPSSTSPLNTTSSNSVPLALKFPGPLFDPLASTAASEPSSSIPAASRPDGRATANVYPGNSLGVHYPSSSTSRHLLPGPSTSAFAMGLTRAAGSQGQSSQEKEGSASPFLIGGSGGGIGGGAGGVYNQYQPYGNDFVSLGDFDPNNPSPSEIPVLSNAQIARLAECAYAASKNLDMPSLGPKFVQNKKRVSKEVLELLKTTPAEPSKINAFRKYSAIYGRFDAKRKPHKVLTLHETSVNEAAAQICLLVPSLLTRRDALFPLARQVVKDAGYNYAKSRKRPCDPADLHSPLSSPGNSPPPADNDYDEQPSGSMGYKEEEKPNPAEWAAMIDKMKNEAPE